MTGNYHPASNYHTLSFDKRFAKTVIGGSYKGLTLWKNVTQGKLDISSREHLRIEIKRNKSRKTHSTLTMINSTRIELVK